MSDAKVSVNAEALRQVLQAFLGPMHHVSELWATKGLPKLKSLPENPVDVLVREYKEAVEASKAASTNPTDRIDELAMCPHCFCMYDPNNPVVELSRATRDVMAERLRQISVEGWTPEHDDQHDAGELASAASAYAIAAADKLHPLSQGDGPFDTEPPSMWCWDAHWWKPGDPRRMLVKSVALGIAEIERMDRAAENGGAA